MISSGAPRRIVFASGLALLALALRLWYASLPPASTDEVNYVAQAQTMRAALADGNYAIFTGPIGNNDHPHLGKILFSLVITTDDKPEAIRQARAVSVAFGTLAVFVLSLASPLAGLLLAIQSSAIKYTGLAMLEAVPQAMILVSVLALRRGRSDRLDGYAIISAMALAIMAATKFSYIPLALVIGYLLHLGADRRPIRVSLGYYAIALAAFLLLMPSLWVDPLGYLRDMAAYHAAYAVRAIAQGNQFPWFQPLIWMARPTPDYQELFPINFDLAILFAGLAGLFCLHRRDGWLKVWWGVSVATLFLWTNKWPQYPMLLYPALALSAARFAERWSARQVWAGAIVVAAFGLRWSAVLVLPVEVDTTEAQTVQAARRLSDAARAGDPAAFAAELQASPMPVANMGVLAGLYWLRDTVRPGEVSLEQSVYLGRALGALFSTATVVLVAFFNLPAALCLAIHSAVIGEAVRADQASLAQLGLVGGLWLTRLPPRFRWLAPIGLALAVAIVPAYLLVLAPLAGLFPGRILSNRRDYLLFLGATVVLLADVIVMPGRLRLLVTSGNWAVEWWQAFNAARQAGWLQAAGDLILTLDVLIAVGAAAGVFVLNPHLALALVAASVLVAFAPLSFRPWFVLVGPAWAYSAGGFFSFLANRLLLRVSTGPAGRARPG